VGWLTQGLRPGLRSVVASRLKRRRALVGWLTQDSRPGLWSVVAPRLKRRKAVVGKLPDSHPGAGCTRAAEVKPSLALRALFELEWWAVPALREALPDQHGQAPTSSGPAHGTRALISVAPRGAQDGVVDGWLTQDSRPGLRSVVASRLKRWRALWGKLPDSHPGAGCTRAAGVKPSLALRALFELEWWAVPTLGVFGSAGEPPAAT
jgi:hypothetical protein